MIISVSGLIFINLHTHMFKVNGRYFANMPEKALFHCLFIHVLSAHNASRGINDRPIKNIIKRWGFLDESVISEGEFQEPLHRG